MKPTDKRVRLVNRFAPAGALWIETGLVTPRMLTAPASTGGSVSPLTKHARRALRQVTRNAITNSPLVIPGLAPISAGLGLIARATSRR